MSQKFRILLVFAFLSSFLPGFAQTPGGGNDLHVNSPYSRIGIGDLAPIGNLRNIGMGGTGISYGHPEFLNGMNPALLINNRVRRYDSLLTILEGGLVAQLRKVSNSSTSQWSGNVNFNSFAYAFPVNKRWTTSIGLRPFSNVSYSTFRREAISGSSPTDTALIQNFGHGGIYQADFANGVRIHKNLNIGFQVSYLFGTIHNESLSQVINLPDSIKVGSNIKNAYSGFLFRPGFVYRKNIQRHLPSDSAIFMNVGFTYDFFGGLDVDETVLIQRKNNRNVIIDQNTAVSRKLNATFPATYRFGVSFDKYYYWNVAADFSYSDWSDYKIEGGSDTLKSSFTIAVGGEFLVNRKDDDLNFKKNYVRAGFSYTRTPLYVNGKQINDMALTLGYTFSVGDAKKNRRYPRLPLPKLNLALVVGQRGTQDNGLLKDLYLKGYVGVTLNDKWFKRRRID